MAVLLFTGSGVTDSPEVFRDAAGRLGDLGFTDLAIPWPRPDDPFAGDAGVLEVIAGEAHLQRRQTTGDALSD